MKISELANILSENNLLVPVMKLGLFLFDVFVVFLISVVLQFLIKIFQNKDVRK